MTDCFVAPHEGKMYDAYERGVAAHLTTGELYGVYGRLCRAPHGVELLYAVYECSIGCLVVAPHER